MIALWKRSLLLLRLRHRLEPERAVDWRTLHRRDRQWYLASAERRRWPLLAAWLGQWETPVHDRLALLLAGFGVVALAAGFALVAGLLTFSPLERINLLWFLLLAVFLPLLWWLLTLLFHATGLPLPLADLLKRRLPAEALASPAAPLVSATARLLGHALATLFALGMVAAFALYLLVTDLAFGWSSTLQLGGDWLHRATSLLAAPWASLWPAAVPSAELVEATRHFRAALPEGGDPARLGQWWRFLWMCLVTYVLLPRLASTAFYWWQLRAMQRALVENDVLIGGLWQRFTTEWADHEAEVVEQRQPAPALAPLEHGEAAYAAAIRWGVWPAGLAGPASRHASAWYTVADPEEADAVVARLELPPGAAGLLLCKGWEPPTGELADFCRRLATMPGRWFLQPLPLPEMDGPRRRALMASWVACMAELPEGFHLIDGDGDE
ncbi:DUF2868 domain-containing protein [Endothiovibrio diazotrophicus]